MYNSTLSLTSALDGGGWSKPRPGLFTTGKAPVLLVLEPGRAPMLVRACADNLAQNGIRSPDRPTSS